MHYIEVYFCQQSEFGDSADASTVSTIRIEKSRDASHMAILFKIVLAWNNCSVKTLIL